MKHSIVIPTLNESDQIGNTIRHTREVARHPENLEIIVVDAGSTDGTMESIKDDGVKTFQKTEFAMKKYLSMNYGLTKSTGDYLIFLDADTLLPKDFDLAIERALILPGVVGGAFEFSFSNSNWQHWLLTRLNRIRYRIDRIYYGDQAVFVKKNELISVGGVPAEPLMETAYMCKQLKTAGRLVLVKKPIKTSPRRFVENGFYRLLWFDVNMFLRFSFGMNVSKYAEGYWKKNLKTENG